MAPDELGRLPDIVLATTTSFAAEPCHTRSEDESQFSKLQGSVDT